MTICPVCKKEWKLETEQSIAIRKRGKCIDCLIKNNEHIEMEPYEFAV